MAKAHTEDTEITLGTGKMLVIFFALVALCGAFFGMGYKVGKGSAAAPASEASNAPIVSTSGPRPSAVKNTNAAGAPAPDVAFYKSASQPTNHTTTDGDGQTTPAADGANSDAKPAAESASPQNAYYVQVAAVSKQEDGEALVDALKRKQYPAFAASGPDKLFHVQVGPFSDIKSAEDMRAKLVTDGYNPILKK